VKQAGLLRIVVRLWIVPGGGWVGRVPIYTQGSSIYFIPPNCATNLANHTCRYSAFGEGEHVAGYDARARSSSAESYPRTAFQGRGQQYGFVTMNLTEDSPALASPPPPAQVDCFVTFN